MTDYVTSADGTRIGYDRYGSGPTVVMVGGAFQHRAIDPDTSDLAYQLGSRGFTVINYDRRGRGDSAGPGTQRANTLDDELADLAAVIAAGGGEAALYGSSSGSAISLAAAAHGLPVTRLALWEPPLSADPRDSADPADPDEESAADFLAGLVARIEGVGGDAVVTYFMKDMPPEWVEGAQHSPVWSTMVEVGPSLAGDASALAWAESEPRHQLFAPIEVPVQVLLGAVSLPLFEAAADSISAALPQATTVRVAGADHRWELESMLDTLSAVLG